MTNFAAKRHHNFDYYINQIESVEYLYNVFEPSLNVCKSQVEVEKIHFDYLINSGTIYGREALKIIGYMNEDFFVDGLDTEYGFRIFINEHVNLFRINKAILSQFVEDYIVPPLSSYPIWLRIPLKIFNKKIYYNRYNYNATRLYGITYCVIVIKREFPGYLGNSRLGYLKKSFKGTVLSFFLGKERWKRTCAYFKGLCDGIHANINIYDTSKFQKDGSK